MAGPLDSLSGFMPSTSSMASAGSSLFKVITYFLLFLVVVVILGISLWVFLSNLKYNKRIVIYEKINGRVMRTGIDRAMDVKFGTVGDYVIYLKKRKKYLAPPTIQTGKKEYWYFIREDGEWFNIGMEDIDVAMRQAKAKFLHTEARAFRTAFQQNLKNRLEEKKFMEKYGAVIMSVILFAVVGLIMWFMADKLVNFLDKLTPLMDTASKLQEQNAQLAQALDRLCSGSGFVPAK